MHAPGCDCPDIPSASDDPLRAATHEAACASRRARQRAARERARRQRRVLLVALLAVIVFVVGWRVVTPADNRAVAELSAPSTNPSVLPASSAEEEPEGPATPLFATYRTLHLHLAVAEQDLTELAFHQAAGPNALPMESLLPDADPALADHKRGTGRVLPERDPDAAEPAVLTGEVIRMWRASRSGPPNTAADIGALAGAPVFSPVTGTVIEVKSYDLYGVHDDLEIHIQPTGWPEIDLVIIHVTDPTVRVGDLVVGGVTRIASVRLLSDRVNHQLGDYTPDPGDHIHMQLNRVEKPGATEPAGES
jgi:murein DD-endopeptidase MepM/ murein hydrolase activator NlpD